MTLRFVFESHILQTLFERQNYWQLKTEKDAVYCNAGSGTLPENVVDLVSTVLE